MKSEHFEYSDMFPLILKEVMMHNKNVAVVGAGFAGISLAASMVRAAVDMYRTDLSITLFEPDIIGPGLAYDLEAPDAFLLNHELDFMGSVNVRDLTDTKDFYKWAQQNIQSLEERYPRYDFTDPKEYVPRSVFGRYLRARYAELKNYAAANGIAISEERCKVDNVIRSDDQFTIEAGGEQQYFDAVVLATGNYFNRPDKTLEQTGKYFRPYDYRAYMSDKIADGSVMLVAGSALSAYDAALTALESGKYSEVIMASRRGMLHKVRGRTKPYVRKFITIENLENMAGGRDEPLYLRHILRAIKLELRRAYGQKMGWRKGYSTQEILQILEDDIAAVENGDTLIWRSIHSSLTDGERHAIYAMLAEKEKMKFVKKYASLYQLFSAPMPITNAAKLLKFTKQGKLKLVNGVRSITYNNERSGFELRYANRSFNKKLRKFSTGSSKYPAIADVCIDATGLGRDIRHLPLYRHLIESGLAAAHPVGGIRTDMNTRYVINSTGDTVPGLYAVGHMSCGETVLPHNSPHISRISITVGADIVDYLSAANDPTVNFPQPNTVRQKIKA